MGWTNGITIQSGKILPHDTLQQLADNAEWVKACQDRRLVGICCATAEKIDSWSWTTVSFSGQVRLTVSVSGASGSIVMGLIGSDPSQPPVSSSTLLDISTIYGGTVHAVTAPVKVEAEQYQDIANGYQWRSVWEGVSFVVTPNESGYVRYPYLGVVATAATAVNTIGTKGRVQVHAQMWALASSPWTGSWSPTVP